MGKGNLPDILTDAEEQALLSAFNVRWPTQYRARTMVRLALETGMRIGDILNLRFEDIDTADGRCHIKNGKGGKDRVLYLRPSMIAELHAQTYARTGLVFTTRNGTRLADANMRRLIADKARKAGISKRVHFHLLRHTYLSRLYQRTRDIRLVQEVAGHADISTTQIYTHLGSADVRNAMIGG